jgi:dipeptidyl-peptidase-4
MKWDFIVVHESGHEWFGNNLTSKDLADMYVHEGYTNYSETLFVEYMYGKEAGNAYNYGIRRGIRNDRTIIPRYNINEEGSGDMYPKAANMLHSIRHSIDDDSLFRQILRGMNRDFYHQTVTTQQIEHYLSAHAGFDYQKVFDQYLRTTQIPDFEYYFSDDHQKVYYRYSNCVSGFDLPLVLGQGQARIRILPTDQWKSSMLKDGQAALFTEDGIKKMYYIGVKPAAAAPQAQRGGGVKWAKDGKGYYAVESNSLVRYDLPAFQRVVIADAGQLTPAGQSQPITVQAFSCNDDEKKWLLYTNSKKVWRLNTRGDYWVLDLTAHTLKPLGAGRPPSSLMFAKLSPDGTRAAYSSEHNLYVEDLASGAVKALTRDGAARMINGTFDWAYEEEFSCRDGFRWSPDSKSIAYWQIDATGIRNFLLIDNTDSLYSFTIPVEYPKAGEDPSACRVGVVDVATGQTTWMQVPGDSRQHYIPRMEWADNSSELVLEQLNRKQNDAKVFICNAVSGAATPVYEETDNAWIDVKHRWSDDPTGWEWMSGGKDFLWVSEKDGWRHLYRISRDGKKETLLTKGNYDLITIRSIDEKTGYVYFMASPDNATQQYLYRISMDGKGKLELVSPSAESGTHSYNISPGALYATHNFSNHLYESVSEWVSLPGHKTIKTNEAGGGRTGSGRTPYPVRMFQLTTDDNVTMDGWMILPKDFDSTKKYPVLFYVYTEPASATVRDAAGSAGTPLYAGDIAADGYIQISLDGRGTPVPKGAAWRKCIYRKIGIINIHDQAMAARKILQWPFVDTSRIAVHGWSGGGSATLNLMFQYPDIYKTGIAIAPVANELLYDNIYQERYMGLPQENRDDFVKGSPIYYAKNLRGNLLVVHGTGDDNVHYQGTEMLINELVKYDKKFQVMVYPNRTHAIREGEGTSLHLSHLFTDYLKEHCPGGGR